MEPKNRCWASNSNAPVKTKPQPLKEWVDQQREIMLAKMGSISSDTHLRNYYEGQADAYMSVLMHMAVYGEDEK